MSGARDPTTLMQIGHIKKVMLKYKNNLILKYGKDDPIVSQKLKEACDKFPELQNPESRISIFNTYTVYDNYTKAKRYA